MNETEGKAAIVAASECGQRASFNEKGKKYEVNPQTRRSKRTRQQSQK
jgi:hypothetical protein